MSSLCVILLTAQVLHTSLGLTSGNSHKIVGGFEVSPPHKYPYMAYFFSPRNKCGATIINPLHALTALHCIKTARPTKRHFLIVGHHRIDRLDAINPNPELFYGHDYIYRVKSFIFRRDGRDIAILRLERSIAFNSRVAPACLPSLPAQSYANMEAVATGWGNTVAYDPGQFVSSKSSLVLREVTLNVVPRKTPLCRISDEAYLCAYSLGKDTCQGDSGGPLTIRQAGVFVLIGVVHGGSGCGAQGYPGIYARVSYFVEWIKENVGEVCTPGAAGLRPQTTEAPVNNADCSCSSFVNKNGFGNCKKKDRDFDGKVSCYVNMPTSCTDLVRSGSNPDKFLSAQACQGGSSVASPTVSLILQTSTMSPMLPPSTLSPMLPPSTMSPTVTTSGCSCSDFVNKNGFGRCKKSDWAFTGSKFGIMSCYVNLPSTCVDLIRSGTDPDKYLSSQACTNRPVGAPFEQVTSPSFPVITDPPVETKPGCQCSDFVNRNGFGLCRKPDRDFGGAVSCYVVWPSTCKDLVRSGSNPDKFLSAEACRLRSLENTLFVSEDGHLGS